MNSASTRLLHICRHVDLAAAQCAALTSQASGHRSAADVLQTRRVKPVLDSHISYLDTDPTGRKETVLFLHGNPTSSYLWRNIIPYVEPVARCVAPDLVGMGYSGPDSSGRYRFVDHSRYLGAWIDSMDFSYKITLVVHDWGSGLGFHWSTQNPARVKSIVFMEALVAPMPSWSHFPAQSKKFFQALRSDAGEDMILKKNLFVERLLPAAVIRKLTSAEMAEYRRPFAEEGESRRPTLAWPREIPVKGDGPEDVVTMATEWHAYLSASKDTPKLYINAEPGFFSAGIMKAVANWSNLSTVTVAGHHFLQEDSPEEIGREIRAFLEKQSP